MKKILSIALLAASAMSAAAAVNPDEFPLMELGKDYQVADGKEFKGRIIAPEDGTMIEYGSLSVYTLGADNELQLIDYPDWQYAGYIKGKQAYQFAVTAGTTYYVYESFSMFGGTICFEMNPKLEVVECLPAVGEVYNVADVEFITVVFNQNVTIGKCTLSCGELSEVVDSRSIGSGFAILIGETLVKWYDSAAITGGETLTITMSDIKDAAGNEIDPVSVSFKAAYTPVTLVEARLPEAILSYMPESSDATKAVFTFSGPMAPEQEIALCYSPVELGYEYVEPLTAVVEGNTVTVDFAGKLRVSEQMSPNGAKYPQFDLRLYSMRDARGQTVLAGNGMCGSYHMQVPFREIPRLQTVTQFTPENGANLSGASEVSIYYNNASEFSFSGVAFTSGSEQVIVNKDELTLTGLDNNEAELKVAIPAGWDSKPDLQVTLVDLASTDGYDHSAEFTAKYNGFVLTFVNPEAGSKLASLAKGRTITVDSNLKSGSALSFSVLLGDETLYGPVAMTERAEGSYIHTMEQDITLYTGNQYSLVFSCGDSAETVTVYGTSAEFEYSPNELISVSPEAGSPVAAGQVITLSFSGLVILEALEESAPFTAACASDAASAGYDNVWALTLGEVTGNEVVIAFRAFDQDNLVVKGTEGDEAQSSFRIVYNAQSGIVEINVAEAARTSVFDLGGRRLGAPVRGINIINGKKVLVK